MTKAVRFRIHWSDGSSEEKILEVNPNTPSLNNPSKYLGFGKPSFRGPYVKVLEVMEILEIETIAS